MNSAQAARVVLVSGAGMATFVLVQAQRQGRPSEATFKSLWAVGALTLGLAVAADFAPEVAGPFALMILIAMAVRNTGAFGSVIAGAGAARAPARGQAGQATGKGYKGSSGPGR